MTDKESGIQEIINQIFRKASSEHFQTGMESQFSRELLQSIQLYGNDAVGAVQQLILDEKESHEAITEALKWMGDMQHPKTHSDRLITLRLCLYHPDATIRDGALLGLSFMDDPDAIPSLKAVISAESIPELRKDMQQVLLDLEETLND